MIQKRTMNEITKTEGSVVIRQKQQNDEIPVYFTDEELNRFFDSLDQGKHYRDFVFFMTLLGTGKRLSEVLAVRKKDINILKRQIKILILKKRKRKDQYIYINEKLAYFLAIYLGPLQANDRLFKFTRQYADVLIKKYGKKAGITHKKVSCHIFRHTYAVRWLEAGLPIHILKEHLGHSHINTTLIYARIVNPVYKDQVDKLPIFTFRG